MMTDSTALRSRGSSDQNCLLQTRLIRDLPRRAAQWLSDDQYSHAADNDTDCEVTSRVDNPVSGTAD